MLRSYIFTLLLLSTAFSTHAFESKGCSASVTEYKQCAFDVPALESGVASVLINKNDKHFSGASAVVCKDGHLSVGRQSCEAKSETDCAIDTASWYGESGEMCSHELLSTPLADGKTLIVSDKSGNGSVEYNCNSGSVSASKMTCGTPLPKTISAQSSIASVPIEITATANSQSAKQYSSTFFFYSGYSDPTGKSERIRADARKQCMKLDEFTVSSDLEVYDYQGFDSNLNNYVYKVRCNYTSNERCDQDIVHIDFMIGSYNERKGEFLNPPRYSALVEKCKQRGYTTLDDVLYLNRTYQSTVDDFTAVLRCSGKQSQCGGTRPDIGDPEIISALSCTEANVMSGLLEFARGTAPISEGGSGSNLSTSATAVVLDKVCSPLGFDAVKTINRISKEDETGGFEYFSVSAMCSAYSGNAPLMASCQETIVDQKNLMVEIIDCDKANVSADIEGEKDPVTGQYGNVEPGEGEIKRLLCEAKNYSTLDSVTSITKSSGSFYHVDAVCSGYYGSDRSVCEEGGDCFGRELSANSQEPSIEFNGKRFLNLCEEKGDTPEELCADCAQGFFEFRDPVTGNTCNIETPTDYSGGDKYQAFENMTVHGEVDVHCNSGVKSLKEGGKAVCYKTCPGNVSVGWDDKNGSQSCSQTIPAGLYKHEQVVSLATSVSNTGNATFKCNGYTGEWEVESGAICKLDCVGSINWGSGYSNSGESKFGRCGSPVGRVAHNATGNESSTASRTTGSASYVCNDGNFEVTGNSCDLHCESKTISWGGACVASTGSMSHLTTKSRSHTGPSSYAFSSTISGSIGLSCNDGAISTSGGTCSYVVREETGPWGPWRQYNSSCGSWSPSTSTVDKGETFEQSRSCTYNLRRTRSVYHIWNDGRRQYVRTDSQYNSNSGTEKQDATGTRDIIGDDGDPGGGTGTYYWGPYSRGGCEEIGSSRPREPKGQCSVPGEIRMWTEGEKCSSRYTGRDRVVFYYVFFSKCE